MVRVPDSGDEGSRVMVVVVVVVYLMTNQRHLGYLSSGNGHLAGRYSTPKIQESRRQWVFKLGQSRYPKTNLKPL